MFRLGRNINFYCQFSFDAAINTLPRNPVHSLQHGLRICFWFYILYAVCAFCFCIYFTHFCVVTSSVILLASINTHSLLLPAAATRHQARHRLRLPTFAFVFLRLFLISATILSHFCATWLLHCVFQSALSPSHRLLLLFQRCTLPMRRRHFLAFAERCETRLSTHYISKRPHISSVACACYCRHYCFVSFSFPLLLYNNFFSYCCCVFGQSLLF